MPRQLRLGRFALVWLGRWRGFWWKVWRWRWDPKTLMVSIGLGRVAFYAGDPPDWQEKSERWKKEKEVVLMQPISRKLWFQIRDAIGDALGQKVRGVVCLPEDVDVLKRIVHEAMLPFREATGGEAEEVKGEEVPG